ncbi:hypothetical protein GW17_00040610 [Ensete ventricosum]|nr:hypothetical protein GW17_00040610 [Ensete ventricosum]
MAARSRGHICHCLGRIEAVRRDSLIAISGLRRRTGGELVKGVRSLARGLADSGVAMGDARMAMELVKPKMLAVDEYCIPWAVELQTSDSLSSIKLYLLIGESSSSFNCNQNCTLFPLKCYPSVHRMLNAYQMYGLHVMVGYWDSREVIMAESAETRWLDTGDIGRLDGKGELWLVGREKGRIKTGGENVYPEEVEAVLSQHPGVSRVMVVGVPDIRFTEKVVACLNIKEGWKWVDHSCKYSLEAKEVSPEILQDHCGQSNLSRSGVPSNSLESI